LPAAAAAAAVTEKTVALKHALVQCTLSIMLVRFRVDINFVTIGVVHLLDMKSFI